MWAERDDLEILFSCGEFATQIFSFNLLNLGMVLGSVRVVGVFRGCILRALRVLRGGKAVLSSRPGS